MMTIFHQTSYEPVHQNVNNNTVLIIRRGLADTLQRLWIYDLMALYKYYYFSKLFSALGSIDPEG